MDFVRRALILKIPFARAEFLASCSHESNLPSDRIPYDQTVLLLEAFRMGIGLKDTAKMMGMKREELAAYGIPFPRRSKIPKPPGFGSYNLLPTEHKTPRKNKTRKNKLKSYV